MYINIVITKTRLHFFPFALENVHGMIPPKEFCDFEKEPGKLWFRSPMIMNGVCCVCIGYVNLTKLDGTARLEFDTEYARVRLIDSDVCLRLFSLKTSDVPDEPRPTQKNQTIIDPLQLQLQRRKRPTTQEQEMVKFRFILNRL